jgi:hypothetical protein
MSSRTDLAKAAAVFRDAFTYDPGHSDLDNEQPITIRVTLGDWRKLDYALAMLDATSQIARDEDPIAALIKERDEWT